MFTCQRALAHINLLLRDYPSTVTAVLEAITLAEELKLPGAAGELYSELGSAYARQGDIARSQAAFQHVIEIDTSTHTEANTDGKAKPGNSPGASG